MGRHKLNHLDENQKEYIRDNCTIMTQSIIARVLHVRPEHVYKFTQAEHLETQIYHTNGYTSKRTALSKQYFNINDRENWLV